MEDQDENEGMDLMNVLLGNIPNSQRRIDRLTKREYFAVKAMQAVIARDHGHTMTQNVITAVAYADALLGRLAETEPEP